MVDELDDIAPALPVDKHQQPALKVRRLMSMDGVVRFGEEDAAVAPVGEFVLVRLAKVQGYDFIGELV